MMSMLQLLTPRSVFVLKFLFLFIGCFLFVSGIFDILHGNVKSGVLELIGGAVSIRLAAFLFSLRLQPRK
jgi:hypothetical protein